jgi:hypothetical protein
MSKQIIIRDHKTNECISVNCNDLRSFGNDREYIAVIDDKLYVRRNNNIYELLSEKNEDTF